MRLSLFCQNPKTPANRAFVEIPNSHKTVILFNWIE